MNVVDQKQIGLTVTLPEFDQRAVLDRIDEFVNEKLARNVNDSRVFLFREHELADRLHEVRLAQTDAAVDEQRVVGAGGRLCDGQARRVRDLVVRDRKSTRLNSSHRTISY